MEFPGGSLAEMQLPPKDLLAFPNLADVFHGVGVFRHESRNSLGRVLSVGSHHASVGAARLWIHLDGIPRRRTRV